MSNRNDCTWEKLVSEEPELLELEKRARARRRLDSLKRRILAIGEPVPEAVLEWAEKTCTLNEWYAITSEGGDTEARVERLVGWFARNPKLRSSEAYDCALEHLWRILPKCRHDDGCGFREPTPVDIDTHTLRR